MAEQSKTVDTALTLLRLVADRPGDSTASLARGLGQSRSAVGRMLVTLESHGLPAAPRTGGWPGSGLLALAAGVEPELRVLARAELEGLAGRFGETAVLSVRDGDDAVAVDQVVGRAGVLQVNYRTGTRHPLTLAASGRALLDPGAGAAVSEGELEPGVRGRGRRPCSGPTASRSPAWPWSPRPTASRPTPTWRRRSGPRPGASPPAWPAIEPPVPPRREEDAVPYYRRVGEVPPKRHTQFRAPDGHLYAEELMGTEGFSASSALLYHRRPPTALVGAEPIAAPDDDLQANEPLLPRHLRTAELEAGGDLVTGRRVPAGQRRRAPGRRAPHRRPVASTGTPPATRSSTCAPARPGSSRRSGPSTAAPATTWSCPPGRPTAGSPPARPATSRSPRSSSRRAATSARPSATCPPPGSSSSTARTASATSTDPTALHLVDEEPGADGVEVLVRQRSGLTRYRYAHHPFDVVGWDGCLYPYRLSIHDFEPITGRVHQPPPVHQTFAGPRFVVCSFVPRKLDYHPDAVPTPYNHANVDSDEVLFYCAGDFTSRKGAGIGAGSISLHPGGFTHGPQPGSVEASLGVESTDELAVMVDTFAPLALGSAPGAARTRRTRGPGRQRLSAAPERASLGRWSVTPTGDADG